MYKFLDFSKVKPGTKFPYREHYLTRSYRLGTLYGPEALQVENERFNRIMKKIEAEGKFIFMKKVESKQRNLSNRFRNFPFSDVSENSDKEKDDRDINL